MECHKKLTNHILRTGLEIYKYISVLAYIVMKQNETLNIST